MYKKVCILVSLAVAVSVVFSCCIPYRWEGLQGFAEVVVAAGMPILAQVFFNHSEICFYFLI